MELLNGVLFLAAAGLSALTVYRLFRLRKGDAACVSPSAPPQLSSRTLGLLLLLFASVAVAVRVYRFGAVPGGFNQDGAMAAVDAKALADHGTDRLGMRYPVHLTAWGFGQMSAMLSYLTAPLVKLFGLSPVVARLPQLLVSLAGLWCLFLFVRDAFGPVPGVTAFGFAAICPWHVLQSRWALDCNLFPHFFLFGVYFLHAGLKGGRRWARLGLSMVFFGLSMYCYGVSIYTVPLFLLAACGYLLKTRRVTWPEAGVCAGIYALVALPFILVMAINAFGWDTVETPLFTLPYFPHSQRSGDILFFSHRFFPQLLANLRATLNVTLLQVKDLPWNDVAGFGTMYLCSMPFALAGLAGLLWDLRKNPGGGLTLLFLLAGAWCGAVTANVNVNRINLIYYPILILIALGLYEVIRLVSLPRLSWGLAAGYVLLFGLFVRTYFTSYAQDIAVHFFRDFTQAVASLEDSGAQHIYLTPDGSRDSGYIGELLVLFYHEIDAEYYQGKVTPEGELPYREKYRYLPWEDIPFDPGEDAAYVIPAAALERAMETLPAGDYVYTPFGSLYTVERR